MRAFELTIFGLTLVGGVGLLSAAVWPGFLEDLVFSFPLCGVSVPLLGCWVLLLAGLSMWDIATRSQWWGLRSTAVMVGTVVLLGYHVPQRVTFACCYSDLQGLVDAAPASESRGVEISRRVGPYHVDRYGADERGGVFFRTATGPDGIGPDQMSYGFAFRPNGCGTPFGNAHYHQRHLFGYWYVFAVSDDS